jgi:hypothetical protein
MSEVHLSTGHQTGQDPKWAAGSLSFENLINVSMSKHDSSPVELGRVRKGDAFHGSQAKLLNHPVVIGGLSASPGVNDKIVLGHLCSLKSD